VVKASLHSTDVDVTMMRISSLRLLSIPVLGLACYVLPLFVSARWSRADSWSELQAQSVEKASGLTFLLLFAVGLLGGVINVGTGAFKFGLLMVALLPAFALLQIVQDPTSHNLWPIEFIIYFLTALIPAAGVLLGRSIAPVISRKRYDAPPDRQA
jgi:hypothetical protein